MDAEVRDRYENLVQRFVEDGDIADPARPKLRIVRPTEARVSDYEYEVQFYMTRFKLSREEAESQYDFGRSDEAKDYDASLRYGRVDFSLLLRMSAEEIRREREEE